MSWLHFVALLLFFLTEPTRSLPPSAIREFGGVNSKVDQFALPISLNRTISDLDAISEACSKSLFDLKLSVISQYVDAIGKPASGLTAGNFVWLGSYAVCQNITNSQYCLASNVYFKISPKQLVPIVWGLCAPSACNKTDIPLLVDKIIEVFAKELKIIWTEDPIINCAHESEWTTGPIITLVVCGIIAYLCLVGTLIDLCLFQQSWKFWFPSESFQSETRHSSNVVSDSIAESTPLLHGNVSASTSSSFVWTKLTKPSEQEQGFLVRFLTCFSITRNTSKVMDCSVPPGAIMSVNGVRVLSMWWVILGHTYLWLLQNRVVDDVGLGIHIVNRFTFNTINSAFFSVDSFFVLSGLLVAYIAFRRMEKDDGQLPLFKFYFHRFWRLTPSYMFVILFFANLYAFLGEGPLWFPNQNSTLCEKYWWTNVLYINNFYPTSLQNECLDWSWYLANDMQFYVISPALLFLIYRFKWKGLAISAGGLLAVSFVVTAVIIDHYDIDVLLLSIIGGGNKEQAQKTAGNFMNMVYIKPYCRISPYLVGMVLGYLIHVEKSAPRLSPLRKIPRQIVCLIGWIVATALGVTVVYGIYNSTKKGGTPFNKAENITYGTFSRFTWGVALAWVIYACNKGYGSLVNKFLSASYWIPLSRLTYSAYLLHPMVLGAYFGSFQHTVEYTDMLLAFYFVSAVVMSYAAAFVLAVCVELPMMQLESVLFFRNKT
ncbi:nose resistant to fluoxetine protein 6-like [Montipora capricornis]|uniref:nose resistant to fluoxetine protein 6-like n=1 Tax=Montipora capricornis TaxID=246305 RepID=UPI0035F1804A